MEQKVLAQMRQDYQDSLKKFKKYEEIMNEIKALEKCSEVIRYKELLEQLTHFTNDIKEFDSDNEPASKAISYAISNNKHSIVYSNRILVYMGTFRYNNELDIEHGSPDFRIGRRSELASYSLYKDLETEDYDYVLISERPQYEEKHTIIFPKASGAAKETWFYKVSEEFFKTCILRSQTGAIEELMKREDIKKIVFVN